MLSVGSKERYDGLSKKPQRLQGMHFINQDDLHFVFIIYIYISCMLFGCGWYYINRYDESTYINYLVNIYYLLESAT